MQPVCLMAGVLGETCRWRCPALLTAYRRRIAGSQVSKQHVVGPAVADDVMGGEAENMLARSNAKQPAADERAMFQIEGLTIFVVRCDRLTATHREISTTGNINLEIGRQIAAIHRRPRWWHAKRSCRSTNV